MRKKAIIRLLREHEKRIARIEREAIPSTSEVANQVNLLLANQKASCDTLQVNKD